MPLVLMVAGICKSDNAVGIISVNYANESSYAVKCHIMSQIS